MPLSLLFECVLYLLKCVVWSLIFLFAFVSVLTVYLLYVSKHPKRYGILSKISTITRIKLDCLESQRQVYKPHNNACKCHPLNAPFIHPNTNCTHRSSTIFISFAGAALLVGGFTFTEWSSTFQLLKINASEEEGDQQKGLRGDQEELLNSADKLFLSDPKQSFYLQNDEDKWDAANKFRELIGQYSSIYTNVILIGASLGASMVCMCSDLANISIAFNPIIQPLITDKIFQRVFLRHILPNHLHTFCHQKIQHNINYLNQVKVKDGDNQDNSNHKKKPKVLHVHWSLNSKEDYAQSLQVKGQCVKNFLHIHDFERSEEVRDSLGAYFWMHEFDQHGLPKYLKSKKILLRILQSHLNLLNKEPTNY